jgi:hypothetical protein
VAALTSQRIERLFEVVAHEEILPEGLLFDGGVGGVLFKHILLFEAVLGVIL